MKIVADQPTVTQKHVAKILSNISFILFKNCSINSNSYSQELNTVIPIDTYQKLFTLSIMINVTVKLIVKKKVIRALNVNL